VQTNKWSRLRADLIQAGAPQAGSKIQGVTSYKEKRIKTKIQQATGSEKPLA